VLAGARKAGQDLGVNVIELGAQSESDVSGQISILAKAVALEPGGHRHRARGICSTWKADR